MLSQSLPRFFLYPFVICHWNGDQFPSHPQLLGHEILASVLFICGFSLCLLPAVMVFYFIFLANWSSAVVWNEPWRLPSLAAAPYCSTIWSAGSANTRAKVTQKSMQTVSIICIIIIQRGDEFSIILILQKLFYCSKLKCPVEHGGKCNQPPLGKLSITINGLIALISPCL